MFLHYFIFFRPITLSLTNAKYTIPPKTFVKITKTIKEALSKLVTLVDNIASRNTNVTHIIETSNDTLNKTKENGILSTIVTTVNK